MTVLKAVLDIDPDDPKMRELGEIAFNFGVIDMTEALVIAYKVLMAKGQQAMFVINEETYQTVVQTLLSCAIMNFASWKHETFEIELPATTDERMLIQFKRTRSAEEHKMFGVNYMSQATKVINQILFTNKETEAPAE